jgi:hypothetical protein
LSCVYYELKSSIPSTVEELLITACYIVVQD